MPTARQRAVCVEETRRERDHDSSTGVAAKRDTKSEGKLVGMNAGWGTIVGKILEAQGHEPFLAADGARALDVVLRDSPALAVRLRQALQDPNLAGGRHEFHG